MARTRKSKKSERVSSIAVLVGLRVSCWSAVTKDGEVSREVLAMKGAASDGGEWFTHLVPKNRLSKIRAAQQICRERHYQYSLPWLDNGLRITPNEKLMEYSEAMRKAVAIVDEAVTAFMKELPDIIANAKPRLGKLGITKDFPTKKEIKARFKVHQDIVTVPDSNDFRYDFGDEKEEFERQVQESMKTGMTNAMTKVWNDLVKLIKKIEDTMAKDSKSFHGSLFSNLKEYCEELPKWNLNNDPQLNEIRKIVMDKLTELNAADLREDKKGRAKTRVEARKILSKISDYSL